MKGKGQGMARGGGKGPMGSPRKPQEEMFAMDTPEIKEMKKQVDFLIDMCGMPHGKEKKEEVTECGEENDLQNVPSQDAETELGRVHDDIAGYGDPEDSGEEYPPGPPGSVDDMFAGDDEGMGIGERIEFALKEEEYKVFFKSMLDKEGIKSIKDLTPEKKKDFFNQVDAAWKAKEETD